MTIAPPAASITLAGILGAALAKAAGHADAVDRDARFPVECIDELRRAGALGCYVPLQLGGLGASFEDLANATF
jgi:acyl-CoA dehydrogenase